MANYSLSEEKKNGHRSEEFVATQKNIQSE
jgi:hypothetical protein